MKRLCVALFLANLLVSFGSAVMLPERIAVHFGPGGVADGWGSVWGSAAIMALMLAIAFAAICSTSSIIDRVPAKWVSLPHKHYWLAPEHKDEAKKRLEPKMMEFGSMLFLFLLFVQLLTVEANLQVPQRLDEATFLTGLVLFLAYTAVSTVRLAMAFRIPPRQQ